MFNCQLEVKNKKDTILIAKRLSRVLSNKDCLCLIGNLGAGKTFLVKSLIKEICKNKKIEVTSPTFNLVNIYDCNKHLKIWHFDLYRIKNEDEIIELDLDYALDNYLVIIEWANNLDYYYPKNALNIDIKLKNKQHRLIKLHTINPVLSLKLNEVFNEYI